MSDVKWNVLLVEDDLELAELIQSYLNGYEFDNLYLDLNGWVPGQLTLFVSEAISV